MSYSVYEYALPYSYRSRNLSMNKPRRIHRRILVVLCYWECRDKVLCLPKPS